MEELKRQHKLAREVYDTWCGQAGSLCARRTYPQYIAQISSHAPSSLTPADSGLILHLGVDRPACARQTMAYLGLQLPGPESAATSPIELMKMAATSIWKR